MKEENTVNVRRIIHKAVAVSLLGLPLGGGTVAHAATASLRFPCSAPMHAMVTCVLRGWGFAARERVAITYHVGARTPANGYAWMTYRRSAVTDAQGSFVRPALRFAVDPRVLAYRVDLVARGVRDDRATISAFGTP